MKRATVKRLLPSAQDILVNFPSIPPRVVPPSTALVLEGGGTRGFFASGVMDAFTEAGIMFPYIVGVSAGAANALTYVAGQLGRSRYVVEHYVGSPRYVGIRNLFTHGSLFNYKFIFDTIARKYVSFDWDAFRVAPTKFYAGAINVETGENEYIEKSEYANWEWTPVIASCCVPILSKIIRYRGKKLLDGGVSDGIPIDKSIADGNSFHVIIMSRNKGYVKPPEGHERLRKLLYFKYPKLLEAISKRHIAYARQSALCEQLEREGKALIIRPVNPLWDSRAERDPKKLLALYDEGTELGRKAISKILGG